MEHEVRLEDVAGEPLVRLKRFSHPPRCRSCGATLAFDARFCDACGTAIDDAAPDVRVKGKPARAAARPDAAAAVASPSLGQVLGGCRLDAVIGRGAMGITYRAQQLDLGRTVAVKVIRPELADDPVFRRRFREEAQAVANLDHPNIVAVHGTGEERNALYLVMSYVDGSDLRATLAQHGPLDAARAAEITAQIGDALSAAHAAGVVHRDVKPANILIGKASDGTLRAQLTDFGVSKRLGTDTDLTEIGRWVGTASYAAPEQIQGRAVEPACDTYALGCVLFQMLTGAVPYAHAAQMQVLYAHVNEAIPRVTTRRPDLPPAFDAVIAGALAKSPAERFASAADLGRAARHAAVGGTVTATTVASATGTLAQSTYLQAPVMPEAAPDAAVEDERPRRRLPYLLAGAGAVVAAAAVGGLFAAGVLPPSSREDARRAAVQRLAQDTSRLSRELEQTESAVVKTNGRVSDPRRVERTLVNEQQQAHRLAARAHRELDGSRDPGVKRAEILIVELDHLLARVASHTRIVVRHPNDRRARQRLGNDGSQLANRSHQVAVLAMRSESGTSTAHPRVAPNTPPEGTHQPAGPTATTAGSDALHWTDHQCNDPSTCPNLSDGSQSAIAYDADAQQTVAVATPANTNGGIQTFTWNGNAWTNSPGPGNIDRVYGMVYDSTNRDVVLLGEENNQSVTYTWDGQGWTRVVAGSGPYVASPSLADDPADQEVVLFGGADQTGTTDTAQTWTWDGSSWTQLTPGSSDPSAREGAGMVYDPAATELYLFGGGSGDGGGPFNDAYTFSAGTWSQASDSGQVRPSSGSYTLVPDPNGNGVIALGSDSAGNWQQWQRLGGSWTALRTAGGITPGVMSPPAATDTDGHTIVVGGAGGDTWTATR